MSELTSTASSLVREPGPLRALGGIWRLTYPGFFSTRKLLTLAGLVAVLVLLTSQNIASGESANFYRWTIGFYLTFLLPAITFLSAAGAVRDDMASVSVDYVLTRPVRRPVLVVLRYVSQMACLQVTSLLALGAILVVGSIEEIENLASSLPHLMVAQVLVVTAFSGLGFLFGSLTTRYLVLGLTYGMLVEVGVGQIPTQVSRLSMTHHILAMLQPVVSDVRGMHAAEGVGVAILAVTVFTLITVAGTALVFSLREFTGAGTAEK